MKRYLLNYFRVLAIVVFTFWSIFIVTPNLISANDDFLVFLGVIILLTVPPAAGYGIWSVATNHQPKEDKNESK